MTRRTYRLFGIGSPGARSSSWCGFASPVVPGGVSSLLTLRVVTRSNVVTDAITIAKARATANKTTAFRCSFMDKPPRATAKRERNYSALRNCALIGALKETGLPMKFIEPRPFADPDVAARN